MKPKKIESPKMATEDAEEWTQSLGQVMAGGYRQIVLAKKLGVPEALGLTTEEWVQTRLGGYVRMSIDERREVATELKNEGLTQREIGEVLGVDPSTISLDLKSRENSRVNSEKTAGSDENSPTLGDVIANAITRAKQDSGYNGSDQQKGKRGKKQRKPDHRWIDFVGPIDNLAQFKEIDLDFIVNQEIDDLAAKRYANCQKTISLTKIYMKKLKEKFPNVFTNTKV